MGGAASLHAIEVVAHERIVTNDVVADVEDVRQPRVRQRTVDLPALPVSTRCDPVGQDIGAPLGTPDGAEQRQRTANYGALPVARSLAITRISTSPPSGKSSATPTPVHVG